MRIIIKDNRDEVILVTNNKNYENDIKSTNFDIWWCVQVEYHDGTLLHSDNGRRVVIINKRSVYAEWNINIEGHRDVADDLIEFLDIDFKTSEMEIELRREEKEYKKFMFQTHVPVKTKAPVKKVEPLGELLDE